VRPPERRSILSRCAVAGSLALAGCDPAPPARAAVPRCEQYRAAEAKRSWDGRSGHVLFHNASARPVAVSLYHPDGGGAVELTIPVGPDARDTLREAGVVVLGNDWGIRVDGGCVELVGRVAAWRDGEFAVTWTGAELRAGVAAAGQRER
jgi:hypothetical protein